MVFTLIVEILNYFVKFCCHCISCVFVVYYLLFQFVLHLTSFYRSNLFIRCFYRQRVVLTTRIIYSYSSLHHITTSSHTHVITNAPSNVGDVVRVVGRGWNTYCTCAVVHVQSATADKAKLISSLDPDVVCTSKLNFLYKSARKSGSIVSVA